jgi:hypothetical protein
MPTVLRMKLVGSNPHAGVVGVDPLPGKSNYFIGNDPKKWRTNVPNYSRVKYSDVYPGIDLVYYGNQGRLEYDFVVAAGADPKAIRISVASIYDRRSGDHRLPLQIAANGDLVIPTEGGEVRFRKPAVCQAAGSILRAGIQNRKSLDGRYFITHDHIIAFDLRPYDKKTPLVIDPVLSYSTYLGDSDTGGLGIAVDPSGDALVIGGTTSSDFPTATSAIQPTFGGADLLCLFNTNPDYFCGDAFVAKLNSTGTALIYSTYLGGSDSDVGLGIAADSSGNAYLTGNTNSSDFPTTAGAFQRAFGGSGGGIQFELGASLRPVFGDAFVTKLDPSGVLLYSTYLGGSGSELSRGIAVDSGGNVYVAGVTSSTNFPVLHAFQSQSPGGAAFVTKLNATGSSLVFSTYLGGNDWANGIAVDTMGSAYVTGATVCATTARCTDFPTTLGAFQPTPNGSDQLAFVTKLIGDGSALEYSTFLGGSDGQESGRGIAVDAAGNAYVTGVTTSFSFPTTPGAFEPSAPTASPSLCSSNAFVSKLDPTGASLVYSTYLGGTGCDESFAIALDSGLNVFVIGLTSSATAAGTDDFPLVDPIQSTFRAVNGLCFASPCGDAFISEFNPAGSALLFSTYLGGSGDEHPGSITSDHSSSVYVTLGTGSTDFPITSGAYQAANPGVFSAVVSKIIVKLPIVSLSPASVTFGSQAVGSTSSAQVVTLTNTGTGTLSISSISVTGDFAQVNSCEGSFAPVTGCVIRITFTPQSAGTRTGLLTISDNASGGSQTVALTGTGVSGNPIPGLALISPAAARAGAPGLTLTVVGSDFFSGSVVRWNGSSLVTTFISSTELTASVPASDLASAGSAQVTVFNPAPGGGTSNALTFIITAAASTPIPSGPVQTIVPQSALAGVGLPDCLWPT